MAAAIGDGTALPASGAGVCGSLLDTSGSMGTPLPSCHLARGEDAALILAALLIRLDRRPVRDRLHVAGLVEQLRGRRIKPTLEHLPVAQWVSEFAVFAVVR